MQTYGASVQLSDRMTPVLTNIMNAVNMTVSSMYQLQTTVSSDFDTSSFTMINETMAQAQIQLDEIADSYREVGDEINKNHNQQVKFNSAINDGCSYASKMSNVYNRIMTAVGSYIGIQGIGELVNLSDDMTSYEARINFLVDSGSVQDVKSQIYAAAQDSRADYADMMASVSKLGVLAGDAFSDSLGNVNYGQIIAFQELMNKNFVIGGASATEQASAMYQLTQALASGKLQGDEFRSITENAPLLNQAIEDYMTNVMGVEGTMKEWAADGLLTADVIKNAVFSSADAINEKFETIPMTWAQVGTSIKNEATAMFEPVLGKINELANNAEFVNVLNGVISALQNVANVAVNVIDILANDAITIANNWDAIAPIITGVATAMGGYLAISALVTAINYITALSENTKAAAQALATNMTLAEAAAQYGLNAALLASPVLWVVIGLVALFAALYKVCSQTETATELAQNSTETTVSGITLVIAWVKNAGMYIANVGYGIWNALSAVCSNIETGFYKAIWNVEGWFCDLLSTALTTIAGICEALNNLPFIEFDYSGIVNKANEYAVKSVVATTLAGNLEYESIEDAFNEGFNTYDAFAEGWNTDSSSTTTTLNQYTYSPDEIDYSSYLSSIEDLAGSTAGSASDINDSISTSSDKELEYLRKLAERESINKFTTAEIKLDVQSNATINSDIDIDGFFNTFTEELEEVLISTAEGLEE